MSPAWTQHLIVAPILLPMLTGAILIPVNESRHQLKSMLNLGSTALLLLLAVVMLHMTDAERWQGGMGVYLAANWAAPFGIALMADRLAASFLLLTATLGLAALMFSMRRWGRIGVHFHSLFQFLLMGLNGAFLTNDLFNLFVFFEVMLAASYGLLLHGYNLTRIRAGMQYIAINLVASLLFLIGVALIYANTGTLNLADLGLRVAALDGDSLRLTQIGATILALAFLTKSAMWPLGFWLPTTYAAASPPVGAMLVLMTKVGVYAILRVWLTLFSSEAGEAAGFGLDALFWGGLFTLAFGTLGMLGSHEAPRMAGFGAIISSGTLLAAIGYGEPLLLAAGLFYLIGSTLAMAALLLLVELFDRIRRPGSALIAVTMEAFAIEDRPEETAGVDIPAALVFLSLSFTICALVITGMPPFSGFVAKFSLIRGVLGDGATVPGTAAWTLIALIILSGLSGIISMMRFGVRTFWASGHIKPPRLHWSEAAPVATLLALCVALTVLAAPVFGLLGRATANLDRPSAYAGRVLTEQPVPAPTGVGGEAR